MDLKPGNFSDPRKIVFVTGHLLLISAWGIFFKILHNIHIEAVT
jgi:hypothetical protein